MAKNTRELADRILETMQSPELPARLALVFLHRASDAPSRTWSYRNRLLMIAEGHALAAGYHQWRELGRQVKKGEKSFSILLPCFKKRDEDGEEKDLVGFKAVPVFGIEQTESIEPGDRDARFAAEAIERLPLREVAQAWGIEVKDMLLGERGASIGSLQVKDGKPVFIHLAVDDAYTWLHELVHAADLRRGTLKEGTNGDREIVAELGAAILLEAIGSSQEYVGECRDYLSRFAAPGESPLAAAGRLLDRTCACVEMILEAHDEIRAACDDHAREASRCA